MAMLQTASKKSEDRVKQLLKATAKVGLWTLLSRILGFLRDLVLARQFGAGNAMDAFLVAFKIPNFFRRLFAEGAFAQAFVPLLSEYRYQKPEELKAFIAVVMGALAGFLLLLTLIVIALAPWVVQLFAPGFAEGSARQLLAADMLRWTFPYLLLISLTAFAGAILNSYQKFAIPAFTPVLLNLTMLGAALLVAPYLEIGEYALAWAVFAAGVLQLLFQLPFLRALGFLLWPRWQPGHPGLAKLWVLMLPAMFAASVAQINLLLDSILASFLANGSVSWLYYGDRLAEFPLGVLGIALSTVVLPTLAKNFQQQDFGQYRQNLHWASQFLWLMALPATLGLLLLAWPIIVTFFHYQAFTHLDAAMTTLALIAYSLGLPAFMRIKVLASAFYARQEMRVPVRIAIIALVANMAMNLFFLFIFHYFHLAGAHAGLALATSLAAWLNSSLLERALARLLAREYPNAVVIADTWRFSPGLATGLLVMTLTLWLATPEVLWWLDASGGQRTLVLLGLLALGGVSFFLALFSFGFRLRLLWQAAKAPPG
jgi:putative peptidoglycan lipid II flippase